MLTTVTENYQTEEAGLAHYYLAFQQKRNGMVEEAIKSFQNALSFVNNREKLKVLEQLAILYEHQLKEYERALHYTNEGLQLLESQSFIKKDQQMKYVINWTRRLQRVEKKLKSKI